MGFLMVFIIMLCIPMVDAKITTLNDLTTVDLQALYNQYDFSENKLNGINDLNLQALYNQYNQYGFSENKFNDINDADLQALYKQYNISDNEVKFAKGELPYYLDGTILDGKHKVVASNDGNPSIGDIQGRDYDIIITQNEMLDIIEKARLQYINTYGVDVENTKVMMVKDRPLPKTLVDKLLQKGIEYIPKASADELIQRNSVYATNSEKKVKGVHNTRIIDGVLKVKIFLATDPINRPIESFEKNTIAALNRFNTIDPQLSNIQLYWYYDKWNSSMVQPYDNMSSLVDNLAASTSNYNDADNVIIMGYVQKGDHNGVTQYLNSSYIVCALHPSKTWPDWPEDSVVQHEVSHCFGQDDFGQYGNHVWDCVMDYSSAYAGVDTWCDSCKSNIYYGMSH